MSRYVYRWVPIGLLALLIMSSLAVQAKTVLNVVPWSGMGNWGQADKEYKFAEEYKKLHPDIDFKEIAGIGMNNYDGLPKLLLALEGGGDTIPDIVETHLSLLPELLQAGVVAPVPEDLAKEARGFFFAPVLAPMERDDKLYGLPTEYVLYAFAYNQRLFDEEGVAEPPKTWAELKQLAMKATRFNNDGSVRRWGFSFPGAWASLGEQATHTFLALLWSNGGTYIDTKGNPHLTDREAIETMQFLQDMAISKAMTSNWWDATHTNNLFMAIDPSWSRDIYRQVLKEDVKDMRTTFIPRGRGSLATCQYGWCFFVTSKSKHPKEAWEFLKWLTMEKGPGGMTRTGAKLGSGGRLPTNPLDLEARKELRTDYFWRGFIESMKYARPEPQFPQIAARWKALGKALEPVIAGNTSPLQGLNAAQKEVALILQKSMKKTP